MPNGIGEMLSLKQTALRLREQRQEVLASNIANADTPNYKARDINFSAALKNATQATQTQSATALKTTSSAHFSGNKSSSAAGGTAAIQYRADQQGRIDGNNVNTDRERMQFAENAMRYEATVTLMTAQIRNMLAVTQN